jgi:dGTPase
MTHAPYAVDPATSRGRLYPEAECPTRSVYQRDRDRIVHSTAFRRLIHKTQVFVYHEGDHYRTRLTHSLEVAQIARTLARALRLNEDLVEAISLAHDLGHTPFGHAGEDALSAAMQDVGGFDHNAQSLRIVTALEHRYAAFRGLNLTWETLEGIVKHNGPLIGMDGAPLPRYAAGLPHAIRSYRETQDLALHTQPSLEAQIAALADDIAYNNHDIDDGFRAGYISLRDLSHVQLSADALEAVRARYPNLDDDQTVYEMTRRMISAMVEDVLRTTRENLAKLKPRSADDIRNASQSMARFSDAMEAGLVELRAFLFSRVYRHPAITEKMQEAQSIVASLYAYYSEQPQAIPREGARIAGIDNRERRQRAVGDFVAGMTDRFALQVYASLFPSRKSSLTQFDATLKIG